MQEHFPMIFFEKVGSQKTMSHPKLTNPSAYVHSTKISCDPKYAMNATQHISTRRSKKLHELREKLSKYTPRPVQLLNSSDGFSLPLNLQSKYQTSYKHALYGAWLSYLPVLDVGTKFSFCGNHFMISKSNIDVANLGLFILSHVLVPPKQSVALVPLYDPIYCRSYYLNIVKYKHSI